MCSGAWISMLLVTRWLARVHQDRFPDFYQVLWLVKYFKMANPELKFKPSANPKEVSSQAHRWQFGENFKTCPGRVREMSRNPPERCSTFLKIILRTFLEISREVFGTFLFNSRWAWNSALNFRRWADMYSQFDVQEWCAYREANQTALDQSTGPGQTRPGANRTDLNRLEQNGTRQNRTKRTENTTKAV